LFIRYVDKVRFILYRSIYFIQ